MFTNSPPLLKNRGVTGLGSLPFVKLLELEQNLYSNNTAETIERLNIPPFGSVSSSLRGPLIASTSQVERADSPKPIHLFYYSVGRHLQASNTTHFCLLSAVIASDVAGLGAAVR